MGKQFADDGRVQRKTLANSAVTSHTFDAAGNELTVENYRSDGSAVNIFTYTYDEVGNRKSALELSGSLSTWTYDATDQLTREQRTQS